jgi:hypothetical protein
MKDKCVLLVGMGLSVALMGGVACSSSSSSSANDSGAGADPFVGTWQCSGTSSTSYTAPASTTVTSMTMGQSVISDDGHGNLTIQRTSEEDGGSPPCTLHATLNADGRSTTGKTPETCPGNAMITQTLTMAGSTMNSNNTSYASSSSFTLGGTNANGKMVQAAGMGSSTCSKM